MNIYIKSFILILGAAIQTGEERFVGDIFMELNPSEIFSTKRVEGQRVRFIEDYFTISVGR
tara:strand:+ start:259 stop:441 length:183 start_codon:yes stop_codon:yes gene_type:complete